VTELTPRVQAAVDAEGANVGINDGEAAGTGGSARPRSRHSAVRGRRRRALHAVGGKRPDLSEEELDAIADDVAAAIDE